jgi:hypothetical protein
LAFVDLMRAKTLQLAFTWLVAVMIAQLWKKQKLMIIDDALFLVQRWVGKDCLHLPAM